MTSEAKWLTVTELSDATKIADSTTRRYLHTFSVFFKHDGSVRGKRYDKNAIKILNRIRELYEKGYENKKVYSFLEEEFAPIFDSEKVAEEAETSREDTHENSGESRHIRILNEELSFIKESLMKQEKFNEYLLQTVLKQGQTIQDLVEELEKQRLLPSPVEETAASTIEEVETVEIVEKVETDPKKKGLFKRIFGK